MRIGINGLAINRSDYGGGGTYLRHLVRSLLDIDRRNQYYLYVGRQSGVSLAIQRPNLQIVECPVGTQNRARRVLPPEFNQHRKQGFSIPLPVWLQSGPWHDFFRQTLLGSRATLSNRKYVAQLFESQGRGRSNSERLFALMLFELWRKEYRIGV